MHTPKNGDRFYFGGLEWGVENINLPKGASNFRSSQIGGDGVIYLPLSSAEGLDWIKPEPTCSKEFAEALLQNFPASGCPTSSVIKFTNWVKSHIEK